MLKFLTVISAIAMAAGLAVAPLSASAKHHDRDDMMMGHRKCPRGSQWVPAHRGRNGHWIAAHCRPR